MPNAAALNSSEPMLFDLPAGARTVNQPYHRLRVVRAVETDAERPAQQCAQRRPELWPFTRPWHAGTLVGFDLETTGTDPRTARVVSAAVVAVESDGRVGSSRIWLVDPGIPIPAEASAVHGISTEQARANGIPAPVAVAAILAELQNAWSAGLPIVVFNAPYDLTLIDAEARRYRLPGLSDRAGWVDACVIDPLVIDRKVDRYRKGKRTLSASALFYGVDAPDAHSADGDAIAACRVARAIAGANVIVEEAAAAALHIAQVGWYAEWAVNFQAYLRSRGSDEMIDALWPCRAG